MYTIKEAAENLKISERNIHHRIKTLGIILTGFKFKLSDEQFELIKNIKRKKTHFPKFHFSNDGEFLIIQSKL